MRTSGKTRRNSTDVSNKNGSQCHGYVIGLSLHPRRIFQHKILQGIKANLKSHLGILTQKVMHKNLEEVKATLKSYQVNVVVHNF